MKGQTRPWTFPLPPERRAVLPLNKEDGSLQARSARMRELTVNLPIGEDFDYIKDKVYEAIADEQKENRKPLFVMLGVHWYVALRVQCRNEADARERQPNELGRPWMPRDRFVFADVEMVIDRTRQWGVRVICEDRDEFARFLEEEWKARQSGE